MNLQKIYASLLTGDLAAAEDWYSRVLGRAPDNRPMPTLVQWELTNGAGLALSTDGEIAGRGVVFIYVESVATERRRQRDSASTWEPTSKATTRRWLKCGTLTGICSRWRRRRRGPFRPPDLGLQNIRPAPSQYYPKRAGAKPIRADEHATGVAVC